MVEGLSILPKGVVKNSPSIYSSLERFKTQPLSIGEISELWKVYTTTKRRLLDPTAERLENFWWRIWGSRSRHLKAAIVVQIFADIAEGQSFVPLTSQANRDEGTPPTHVRPLPRGTSSTTAIHRSSTSKPGTTPKQTIPPPSILKGSDSTKKARHPSTSGPKPTARFISPHESEEEMMVSPKTSVVIHPPSPVAEGTRPGPRHPLQGAKKKAVFVASARGKRPVVVRRQSSQSSAEGSTRTDHQIQSSADRTPPNFADHAQVLARQRGQTASQDNSSSSSGQVEKKAAARTKTLDRKLHSPRKLCQGTRKSSQEDTLKAEAGPSRRDSGAKKDPISSRNLTQEETNELQLQELLSTQANARILAEQPAFRTTITSAPRQPDGSATSTIDGARAPTGVLNPPALRSKSAVSVAPTLATAIGHTDTDAQSPTEPDRGNEQAVRDPSADEFFSRRPVEAFSPASVPHSFSNMSRSKSQLTLLLEKDRTKSNERSASSINLKGKQKK